MEDLNIKGTEITPEVKCSSTDFSIRISGDSSPEDARSFYSPIISWIDDFEKHLYFIKDHSDSIKVKVEFEFEYLNSTSAKFIFDMLKALERINKEGKGKILLEYFWYYEEDDDDMLDSGEELKDMLSIENFNINSVN